MPGVVAVLTGAELADRQDRQSDLRLDDPFQGRLADENGGASGARQRQGLPRRRCGRRSDRRDAGAGARRRREGQSRLCGAARGRRSRGGAKARRAANPRRRAEQYDLPMASRRRQGGRRRVQGGQARHQARHRQQSPGAERDRAARGDRRLRCRHRRVHAVEHHAKSARRAARHRRLRRHGAGAQVARHRARRRRRLRLEDFHLSRGSRGAMGVASASAGR